jgi:hypothetical protein
LVSEDWLSPQENRQLWLKRWPWRLSHMRQEAARVYVSASAGGLLILDPVPPGGAQLPGTPRPSATAPPLPTPTLRIGEAERVHRIYLPWTLRPLPKLAAPPKSWTRASSGGSARHVATRDGIVYLQKGDHIQIHDARHAGAILQVGSIKLDLGPGDHWWPGGVAYANVDRQLNALQVDGDQLLVLTGPDLTRLFGTLWVMGLYGADFRPTSRLQVFDLSNPLRPVPLGELEFEGIATSFYVKNSRGYLGLIDRANAAREVTGRLLSLETGGGRPRFDGSQAIDGILTRLEQRGSLLAGLQASGNKDLELKLFDSTLANAPRLVSRLALPSRFSSAAPAMHLDASFVTIFHDHEAAQIIDIGDPGRPIPLEPYDFRQQLEFDADPSNDLEIISEAIRIEDQLLLLDGSRGRLAMLDLRVPGSPRFVDAMDLSISLPREDLYADIRPKVWAHEGRRLYLSGGERGGLSALDLGPPLSLVGSFEAPAKLIGVAAGQDRFYAIGVQGIDIYEVAALPEFRRLGQVDAEALQDVLIYGLQDIVLDGSRLVLASADAVNWFELGSPSAPLSGRIGPLMESSHSIDSARQWIYVAEEPTGLKIYALDDLPGSPQRGHWFGSGTMLDVAIDRDAWRAYVASGLAGLSVLDTRNPAAVREIASLDVDGTVEGISIHESLGLMLSREGPKATVLSTLDLGQLPPAILGRMVLPAGAAGPPQLVGSRILQRLDNDRLWLLDASDPRQLRLAAEFPGRWQSAALSPDGRLLYLVAEGSGQLTVLQLDW